MAVCALFKVPRRDDESGPHGTFTNISTHTATTLTTTTTHRSDKLIILSFVVCLIVGINLVLSRVVGGGVHDQVDNVQSPL